MAQKIYSLKPLFEVAEKATVEGHPAAIGAFNVNFYAQGEGILEGLIQAGALGIIQASKGANKFQGGAQYIQEMIFRAMERFDKEMVPICIHLDHGDYKSAEECINGGFSSVMADFSTTLDKKKTPLEENIRLTREVVLLARKKGVSVEGEIGVLRGQEEDKIAALSIYPSLEEVIEYVIKTEIDGVAVACGTCHGPIKDFKRLELDLLKEIYSKLKEKELDARMVLHGSSTVPKNLVEELKKYGGELSKANGVPLYAIKEAVRYGGVRKINIDTDLRMGITVEVRKYILENPGAEKKSNAIAIMKNYLFGKPTDKEGKLIDVKEIIDPRDYLRGVMELDPTLLREDYRKSGDRYYISLMDNIKNRVASHVEYLVGEFGSAGLARKI